MYHVLVLIFALVAMTLALAFAVWISFPSAKALRIHGERFAREHLAFVDSEFVVPFDRAYTRNRRQLAVMFVALIAAMLVLDRFARGYASDLVLLPIAGLMALCVALLRLRMAGREFPVPSGRSVVARVRRVGLDDYVSRPVRTASWIVVCFCLGMAAWATVHPYTGEYAPATRLVPALAAGTLVVALVVVEVVGRAVCGRPQAAVDPCHLYFQDAWRGVFLVGAYVWVSWGAFQFLTSVPLYVLEDLPDSYFSFLGLAVVAEFACLFRSRRYFRARLWPTLLPGQVLHPGQSIPTKPEVFA